MPVLPLVGSTITDLPGAMRPRASNLSTTPVTFEASQDSVSASALIASGTSGFRVRNASPWTGVRSRLSQVPIHHPRRLNPNSVNRSQRSSGAGARDPTGGFFMNLYYLIRTWLTT